MSPSWSGRCSARARWLGAPLATLVLATLGVIVYFGLIRDIMKGPMLAQILGTFGLALLLRYSVFWWFGANFLSLPENIVGGTFDVFGLRIEASRLLAGVVALLVTLGLHLLADAHLAGLEDAGGGGRFHRRAADGHPPRHHAGDRLGDRRGRHRPCRRADRDLLLYRADGRRDAGIVAFVTVSLGGFGSVPGALVAGLLIGVIESLSAYLIGAVYKDIVVYALFLGFLWFRPQGLMGKT